MPTPEKNQRVTFMQAAFVFIVSGALILPNTRHLRPFYECLICLHLFPFFLHRFALSERRGKAARINFQNCQLTAEENELSKDLRLDHIKLRLEQEHIGYGWLCKALEELDNILTFEF